MKWEEGIGSYLLLKSSGFYIGRWLFTCSLYYYTLLYVYISVYSLHIFDKYFFEWTKYSIKHNRGGTSKMNEEMKG